ncbi:putative PAP2 superfamily protein [Kamptonema sp. PCC 6506]|uniref:phosphatase PAP2 family protein n=1 Tax=Kamptonema formosum TaxID=331992 RepID=UPI0001DAD664|nr:phosphatase PAP2 family protein [Kamptonema formosum]CBN57217.1 putative PAP2 superfamily protein [Kamptonema sp. PCC 6506]
MRSKLLSLLSLLTTIRLVGLATAAFALWGFAEIAEEVLEKETQAFDTEILLSLRSLHTPVLNQIMVGFTYLGQPSLLLVICLNLGLILLLRNHRSEALTIAIGALGAVGLNTLLKKLFARTRPQLWERIVDVRFYSFPSGHAMMSMVIYGLLGYFLASYFPRWRWLIAILTVLLVTTIGFSRMYLGVHWPTDVIAGYIAGFVWLITCIITLEISKELQAQGLISNQKFISSDN